MLTNYDLEELCDTYGVALRGIYMKDMLPQRAQNGNYIINLESSNGGKNNGTHWTCLVVHDKKAMFYDLMYIVTCKYSTCSQPFHGGARLSDLFITTARCSKGLGHSINLN